MIPPNDRTPDLKLSGDGDEPLIVHNGLLADRDYEVDQEAVRDHQQTEEDRRDHDEVARLEWNGSLYFDDELGPILPGDNVRRCLLDAAG